MTDAARHPDPASASTPTLISDVLQRLSALVRFEVDLARAEIDRNLRKAGTAIGMIVVAVALALTALNVLAAALTAGIAELGLSTGWSAVVVGVAFGLLAWIAMAWGMRNLSLSSLAPTRTAEDVRKDVNVVAGGRNAE